MCFCVGKEEWMKEGEGGRRKLMMSCPDPWCQNTGPVDASHTIGQKQKVVGLV